MKSVHNLEEYLSNGVESIVNEALKASLKNLKEGFFMAKFSISNKNARRIRRKHEQRGEHIPTFLIGSITNKCNLPCKECYAGENHTCGEKAESKLLGASDWEKIFIEAAKLGIRFILLAGGEPLMRRDVLETAAKLKNIIFPIFTNGTLLDENYLKLFYRNRNLFPVFSIEGDVEDIDKRSDSGVFEKLISSMEVMKGKKIFFGASVTVTRENVGCVTGDVFLSELYFRGCKAIFFVEYVPVNSNTEDLSLTKKERDYLNRMLMLLRIRFEDMLFISFPGDNKSSGGCLAAGRGFFYINPFGKAEPPFPPYSDTDLREM